MALDAAHRASIYEKLRPLLGDEDANILMSEFPSVEADELVTKDFLRAELALTKGELRAEMALLRGEVREEMAQVRGEVREEMAQVRGEVREEMAQVRTEMAELKSSMLLWLGSGIAASAALQIAAIGLSR
jgi:hypothetical protein